MRTALLGLVTLLASPATGHGQGWWERAFAQGKQALAEGDHEGAVEMFEMVLDLGEALHIPAFWMAVTYAVIEDYDQAFDWLERAYEFRDPTLNWIKVTPFFDPMRSSPRYVDLLERAGIPLD